MASKFRSQKKLIIAAIAIVVIWIIYWFCHFNNTSSSGEEQIIEPTIGYEFVDQTIEPGDNSFIHLNKDLLKETSDDNQQSDEDEDDDLEYVDFNNILKSTPRGSFPAIKPRITNSVRKYRFRDKSFTPDVTKNVLVVSDIPPRKEGRKIDDYYHDDKGPVISKGPYILIHNAAASIVNNFQEVPLPFPVHIPKHLYTFTSERLPKELHLRPSLGNGFIGTVVHGPHVFISGIYNGKKDLCHKAAVPSTASFNISGTEPSIKYTRTSTLDVSNGIYSEESDGESHSFVQKIYAHRTLANLLVTEVDYERKQGEKHVTLKIDLNRWHNTQDFTFTGGEAKYPEVSYKVGVLNFPETNQSSSKKIHIIYDHIPSELKPPGSHSRCKWVFLTAYGFNQEEAERNYDEGMKLLVSRDELYTEHVKGWSQLWRKGRIDVDGDDSLSSALYAGFYHLLSSIPLKFDNFVGLSASGLPYGNESFPAGDRIRADQELFVFPALLLMHSDLSRHILQSRNFTMGGAYENARKGGLNGLAFPYEGASVGEDLGDKKTGFASPHVTASVLFAIKQYLDATNDTSFVNQTLSQLVFDAADFLHSRLSPKDDAFHVLNQVSIDEGLGTIHDSISGNALISEALRLPFEIDSNQTRFLLWREDAAKIFLPKLSKNLHASHSDYKSADRVGEADVLMLNFPLMMNISGDTISQDLTHYEKALTPNTSPMSKALLAISWLDVGHKARAHLYLKSLLPHFASPFKTWISHYHKGFILPNHLPAIGGLLQTVIFGYGGIRLREDRMDIDPEIPLNVTSVHYVGIDYLGNVINIVISQQETSIMVTKMAKAKTHVLYLHHYEKEDKHRMDLNVQITVKRARVAIISEAQFQNQS